MAVRQPKYNEERKSVSSAEWVRERDAFRRANAAFAEQFFAAHNSESKAQKTAFSELKSDFPDFSFAKKQVVSYYDHISYVTIPIGSEGQEENSASDEERGLASLEGHWHKVEIRRPKTGHESRLGQWLKRQSELSDLAEQKYLSEMADRRINEAYVLVEDLADESDPDGFDQYESAAYQSFEAREDLNSTVSLIRNKLSQKTDLGHASSRRLVAGTLALQAEPLADSELIERLAKRAEAEAKERDARTAELNQIEASINLKKLYKAIGQKRLAVIAASLAVVLTFGALFTGLLMRQARIVEMNFKLAEKKTEIAELQAGNQEKYEKIMELYDLNEVKTRAVTELGLRPASQKQRIHIYLPSADRCILYSQEVGEKDAVKEDIIAFDYLNYQKLEDYFDGVGGLYE